MTMLEFFGIGVALLAGMSENSSSEVTRNQSDFMVRSPIIDQLENQRKEDWRNQGGLPFTEPPSYWRSGDAVPQ